MNLRANAIIEPAGDASPLDCPHRILWCSKERNETALFRLDPPLGMPFYCEYVVVAGWIKAKEMRMGQYALPSWVQAPEDQIPQRDRRLRDQRWNLIRPLVTGANREVIFDKEMRGYLIRKHATEAGKNREWLYPLLKLYWRYGQIPNALLPAFQKCARRGEIRGAGDKKRGRRPKVLEAGHDSAAIGVNVGKDDLNIFVSSIRYWHLRKGLPLTKTYDHMVDKYYSTKELRGGEVFAIPIAENKKIKMPTFRYWAKRLLADQTLLREVMDEVLWGKKHRGHPGKASDTTSGPTDIFEIDATPDNCHLVSEYHPNHLIGRMIIYYVIDRSSTMIVGLHTALEGPSWNTARMAIYNAFSDKVEYCRQYGVEISTDDWPCQEICSLLVADQGDVFTKAAQASLQEMLHLDSDYNAAGQADRKGTVEGKHVQINEQISWVAGAWRARAEALEKNEWKGLLDNACLTLAQRTQLIIHEVLDHNNNDPVPDRLTKEMIQDGVRPYRRDIYLWGLENQTGEPPAKPDPQQLYRCLLPTHRVSITEAGIVFHKMTYLPEGVDHEMLLARARRKRIPVTIHVDPNSTNYVFQFDTDSGKWARWRLSAHSWERYANMRLEEVLELHATQEFAAHDAADQEAERSSVKRQKQREIEKDARKRKNAAPPRPGDAARIKGTAQHRKREKELERARLARNAPDGDGSDNDPATRQPKHSNYSAKPTLREIMARRKAKIIAGRSNGKI
jgi:putative transposase